MHPILFEIGPLTIRSYGVMLAIAFGVGALLASRRAERAGLDRGIIGDMVIRILVTALVGARLFYAAFHWDEFADQPWQVFSPFQNGKIGIAGLNYFGGLMSAALVSLIYLRRRGAPVWRTTDVIVPSVALGMGFTRLGCFLNGCCYGLPTEVLWGVAFPTHSAAGFAFGGLHLHPTQLYSSAYGFMIFGALLATERYKRAEGGLLVLFVLLLAFSRFTVDFFRYYEGAMRVTLGGVDISVNQVLALVFFVLAVAALVYPRAFKMPPAERKTIPGAPSLAQTKE